MMEIETKDLYSKAKIIAVRGANDKPIEVTGDPSSPDWDPDQIVEHLAALPGVTLINIEEWRKHVIEVIR